MSGVIDLPTGIAAADQALHAGLTLHALQALQRGYDSSGFDFSADHAEAAYVSKTIATANAWTWLDFVCPIPSRLAQPGSAAFRRQVLVEWLQSGSSGVTLSVRAYLLASIPDIEGDGDLDPDEALLDVDSYVEATTTSATPAVQSGTITVDDVRAFEVGAGTARGPVALVYVCLAARVKTAGSPCYVVGPRLREVP